MAWRAAAPGLTFLPCKLANKRAADSRMLQETEEERCKRMRALARGVWSSSQGCLVGRSSSHESVVRCVHSRMGARRAGRRAPKPGIAARSALGLAPQRPPRRLILIASSFSPAASLPWPLQSRRPPFCRCPLQCPQTAPPAEGKYKGGVAVQCGRVGKGRSAWLMTSNSSICLPERWQEAPARARTAHRARPPRQARTHLLALQPLGHRVPHAAELAARPRPRLKQARVLLQEGGAAGRRVRRGAPAARGWRRTGRSSSSSGALHLHPCPVPAPGLPPPPHLLCVNTQSRTFSTFATSSAEMRRPPPERSPASFFSCGSSGGSGSSAGSGLCRHSALMSTAGS